MAVSFSDIVKQGYVKMKSRKLGLWQRRWIILHRASSKGANRLEKFLDEKSARIGISSKIMILNDVSNIARLPSDQRKYAICIRFNDDTKKEFACDSDLEADDWVKVLWQECVGHRPGFADGEPDVLGPGVQKELKERFHVYLVPNSRLGLSGECLLQVTHENIHIWDAQNYRNKLVTWPLTSLRRYGRDSFKFTFESGRHCSTGEGVFVFSTVEGEEIYQKVHYATSAIAEAQQRIMSNETQKPMKAAETPVFCGSDLSCLHFSASSRRDVGTSQSPVEVVGAEHNYVNLDYFKASNPVPRCRLTQHLIVNK